MGLLITVPALVVSAVVSSSRERMFLGHAITLFSSIRDEQFLSNVRRKRVFEDNFTGCAANILPHSANQITIE